MRATKAPSKMEIGRRPDRRTEVSELAPIDIVNNLATGEKAPERRFSVLFLGISPSDGFSEKKVGQPYFSASRRKDRSLLSSCWNASQTSS